MPGRRFNFLQESASTGAGLPLAVEVDNGSRKSEVIVLGKVPGVELLPPSRRVKRLPTGLLEEDEHDPMDSGRRVWILVFHHLLPWKTNRLIDE